MARGVLLEFARTLAEKHGIRQDDAQSFLDNFVSVLNDGLRDEKLVKVKGLGTFKVIETKDRASVNVNTGERIVIEGRGKITFTPDSVMKELVNKPFSQFETVVLNEGVEFDDNQEIPGDEDNAPSEDVLEPIENQPDADKAAMNPQTLLGDTSYGDEAEPAEPSEEPAEQSASEPEEVVAGDTEQPVNQVEEVVAGDTEQPVEEPEEVHPEDTEQPADPVEAAIAEEAEQPVVLPEEPVSEQPVQQAVAPEVAISEEQQQETEQDEADVTDKTNKATKNNQNNTETENEETTMEEKTSIWGKLLSYLIVVLVSLGIGYYLGMKNSKVYIPMGQSEMINGEFIDSTSTDSLRRLDSINTAREARIKARVDSLTRLREARNESINAKKNAYPAPQVQAAPSAETKAPAPAAAQNNVAEKTKKEAPVVEKAVPLPQGDNSKGLNMVKQMAKTGAYTIVGTQETVTVKAGQTMKSISKFYFGDGMECYLQAYNGVTEVKEGMKLRIPKLQIKKKK